MPGEVEIPVYRNGNRWHLGDVAGYAIVDADDGHFAEHRWGLDLDGYARRSYRMPDGRKITVLLHREILGLNIGDPMQGDHRNGDRLNNRRSNLRVVTPLINGQNKRPFRKGTSKYRGVHWNPQHKKWGARICVNGDRMHLGWFVDEKVAANTAAAARLRLMPEAC